MKTFWAIGCFLLLMGGCSLAGSAAVQSRLDAVPRMTCDQLIRKGPPMDGQVALTDLQPCEKGFVATRYDGDLDLYIPAYPAHLAGEPEPQDLKFLLQVWSDEDRHLLLDQPRPSEVTCWATQRARIVTFSRGPGEVEDWVQDHLREISRHSIGQPDGADVWSRQYAKRGARSQWASVRHLGNCDRSCSAGRRRHFGIAASSLRDTAEIRKVLAVAPAPTVQAMPSLESRTRD